MTQILTHPLQRGDPVEHRGIVVTPLYPTRERMRQDRPAQQATLVGRRSVAGRPLPFAV